MTGASSEACPFCRKLAESGGADVVWEFPHSLVILGTWQFYEGYLVAVSRSHVRELFELDPQVRHAFVDELALLGQVQQKLFAPRKLNVEMLGNQVEHLHCHLFPRSLQDPDHLKPAWVALDRTGTDEGERRRLERPEMDRGNLIKRVQAELSRMAS
jgi:diadenosine tetraphosphate (Ap4A) HIT family hydrolase